MPSRRQVALAALVVGLVAVVATAAASPQPRSVCSVCGSDLDRNVTSSTVEIDVEADGDARWTVRNRVTPTTADELRSNPDRREELVRDSLGRGGVTDEPYEDVATRMDDDVLVITFVDPDAARTTVGDAVLVDYLHAEMRNWYVLNAEEFTVRAPEGYALGNAPTGATAAETSATWTGNSSSRWVAPDVENAYVAFAPDGVGASLWGTLAVWHALATFALANVYLLVLPTAIFGATLGGTVAVSRYAARATDRGFAFVVPFAVAAVVGLLIANVTYLSAPVGWFLTLLLLALGAVAPLLPRYLLALATVVPIVVHALVLVRVLFATEQPLDMGLLTLPILSVLAWVAAVPIVLTAALAVQAAARNRRSETDRTEAT